MSNLYSVLQTLWNEQNATVQPVSSDSPYFYTDTPEVETNEDEGSLSVYSAQAAKCAGGNYKDITVFLGSDKNSEVILKDVPNALVRTQAGDDYIDIVSNAGLREKSQIHVFANQGNDMVVLYSNAFYNVSYRLYGGDGDDRLISSGRSHVLFNGGEGDDTIIPGDGNNMIVGGEGIDEVVFFQNQSHYDIREIKKGHLEVVSSDLDGNGESAYSLMGVELLRFKDGVLDVSQGLLYQNAAEDNIYNKLSWSGFSFSDNEVTPSLSLRDIFAHLNVIDVENEQRHDPQIVDFHPLPGSGDGAHVKVEGLEQEFPKDLPIPEAEQKVDDQQDMPAHKGMEGQEGSLSVFNLQDEDGFANIVQGTKISESLTGSWEKELLLGDDGDDRLYGWGGDDVLIGGDGNDHLEGSYGDDIIVGGEGEDTAFYWGFASEFELDLTHHSILDLLDDYGQDQLVSIEKIGFIDATYRLSADGVEKIDNGLYNIDWGPSGELNVIQSVPADNNTSVSYQSIQTEDDPAQTLFVDI
ncbi:hypothetical protein [Terasakiella sp.]|uniref:hypothetical protein n=1 Tax=Terasakiella sp. TaxID=2034861 RepID=UPI003AA92774